MGTYALAKVSAEDRSTKPGEAVAHAVHALDRLLGRPASAPGPLVIVAIDGGPKAAERVAERVSDAVKAELCSRCGDITPCPADRLAPGGTCPHPAFESWWAGAPNEAQSETVKAVRAMQDADRAGARQPTPGSPGWVNARTVQMIAGGDELLFEVIRAEAGSVEQVVDVLPSGGLRIRARCGEYAPASEEGVPDWVKPGMLCVRWEGHGPPHRVARREDGPFFDWQDVDNDARAGFRAKAAEAFAAGDAAGGERLMWLANRADTECRDPAPAERELAIGMVLDPDAFTGEGYETGAAAQSRDDALASARAILDRLREIDVAGGAAQRQDSLDAQLRDVAIKATLMGCYDAADFIGRRLAGG